MYSCSFSEYPLLATITALFWIRLESLKSVTEISLMITGCFHLTGCSLLLKKTQTSPPPKNTMSSVLGKASKQLETTHPGNVKVVSYSPALLGVQASSLYWCHRDL